MLERLFEINEASGVVLDENMKSFIKIFLEVFGPVKITTLQFQESQLLIGYFYMQWIGLKLKLQTIENGLARKLCVSMCCRETQLLDNSIIFASLYIDPIFGAMYKIKMLQLQN